MLTVKNQKHLHSFFVNWMSKLLQIKCYLTGLISWKISLKKAMLIRKKCFRIAAWNANRFLHKINELDIFVRTEKIDICLISEI